MKHLILLAAMIAAVPAVLSQDPVWVTDTLIGEEINLPYHWFVPENYDSAVSYPIVVDLHGANLSLDWKLNGILTSRGAGDFVSPAIQSQYPCFVLLPFNDRAGYPWLDVDELVASGEYISITEDVRTLHPLIELIDSLVAAYPINPDRIYLSGTSGGANGAWAYLAENPEYFAAASIRCGSDFANSEAELQSIIHIPVWHHHGEKDNVVETVRSRATFLNYEKQGIPVFYTDLQKYVSPGITDDVRQHITSQGIDYIFSEHPGLGHNVWDVTFDDPLTYEWLFSKRKRTRDIVSFLENSVTQKLQGEYTLVLGCEIDTLQTELQYSGDLGYNWVSIGEYPSDTDSIIVNTRELEDSPQGQFRILLKDQEGHVIGSDYSVHYKVDNEGNCAPWLRYYVSAITDDYYKFVLHMNDAEEDSLELSVLFRSDRHSEYALLQHNEIEASNFDRSIIVVSDTLKIRSGASIKFVLSDGDTIVSDSTSNLRDLDFESTSIWVWPEFMELSLGDSAYLNYGIMPIFEPDRITLIYSGNEQIATISGHMVNAVSPGETYVYYSTDAGDGLFIDSCKVKVFDPNAVGISSLQEGMFSIYPNPARDVIHIQTDWPDQYEIRIFAVSGQQVMHRILEGPTQEIDLSPLRSGIYIIRFRSEKHMGTAKVIKNQ